MSKTAHRIAVVFLGALTLADSGQALQKCVDRLGKVTYTDEPCTADHKAVKVETFGAGTAAPFGSEPLASPGTPKSAAPSSSNRTTAMKAYLDAGESARKRVDLEEEIRQGELSIDALQRSLDGELRLLQRDKGRANNNLAGATWEVALSNEMSALIKRYDTRIRVAQDRVENARRQLVSLK